MMRVSIVCYSQDYFDVEGILTIMRRMSRFDGSLLEDGRFYVCEDEVGIFYQLHLIVFAGVLRAE